MFSSNIWFPGTLRLVPMANMVKKGRKTKQMYFNKQTLLGFFKNQKYKWKVFNIMGISNLMIFINGRNSIWGEKKYIWEKSLGGIWLITQLSHRFWDENSVESNSCDTLSFKS